MKPTKRNKLVKAIAEEYQISEEDVDNIVYYYYKYAASLMEKLTDSRIYLPKLGTYILKTGTASHRLKMYKDYLETGDRSKIFNKHVTDEELAYKVERLTELLQKERDVKVKAFEIKKQKYESNRDMEK
ncbi:MAG: hypothetical protein EOL97_13725 [Spirochaetia bacterium]|nr:hypothetical protein [Spirochaetia bacterium]